jgi:hypothetical protein
VGNAVGADVGMIVGCGEGSGQSDNEERPANRMFLPASFPVSSSILKVIFQLDCSLNVNSILRLF